MNSPGFFCILIHAILYSASLVAQMVKNLPAIRPVFDPWVGKIPWRREQLPTPVFWPGEFHGQRSLAGYSPWGHREQDTTEQLSLHFILYSGSTNPSHPCLHSIPRIPPFYIQNSLAVLLITVCRSFLLPNLYCYGSVKYFFLKWCFSL